MDISSVCSYTPCLHPQSFAAQCVWPINQQHLHPWKLSKNTNCQVPFRLTDSESAVSQVTWMHIQFWASLCQNTYQTVVLQLVEYSCLPFCEFLREGTVSHSAWYTMFYIAFFQFSSRKPCPSHFATRTLLVESNLTNLLR